MDDFPSLLARDFGFRPQAQSAPMSATKPSPFPGSLGSDPPPPFYDDVFAQPPRFSKPASIDSIFDGFGDPAPNRSKSPPGDKPVYDDDFDNVFAGMAGVRRTESPPPYDDIFESLGRTERGSPELKEQASSGFEELIPGFGVSSPQRHSESLESEQQSTVSSAKPIAEDPFVVLETNSASAYPSSVSFTDPLEHINSPMDSENPENAPPASGGLFDDEEFSKTVFTSKIHDNPLETSFSKAEKESSQRSFRETFENIPPKVHPTNFSDSVKTAVDHDGQKFGTSYSPYERYDMADPSPKSYEHQETADDVWLTVDEIPLFTQPTSGPPPSRPPPPVSVKQASSGRLGQFYTDGVSSNVRYTNGSSQPIHTNHHVKNSGSSPIDELEDFVSGRPQRYGNEHTVPIGEEELETSSATAAMKEAMDRAEAKFKHAREVRERERDAKSAKSRETEQKERYEKAMSDAQYLEEDEEKQRLANEQEQRERDEKEEQKRRQKEREQLLEREKGRQAVERATREARERASVEARLKAERAAVEKANAEARQRAERAAFQKASAEARERAAIEARQKAESERAAAEARERERAAAEARERERERERERVAAEARERERAAVRDRAAQEALLRAQRAAVEKVNAEARGRYSAEAQRRAAATTTTRERQQTTEIDVESFFNFGARPSSAPKQRTPTSEAGFGAQFQNKGVSDGLQRTSTASASAVRKAQPTVNIADDLASIFGAPSSSGDFQQVDGETEERRRARLERHQRTLERTAKALAEKNDRDMQVQRDQAERNRIAETLDFEIKRWAAGKEGNLRALLSTLQYVLWPECGWQPVSLSDLINGASVKKVYRKATLCIHPDKVQQKGATLQQKYIAEKVFDLLKEAWNKLNSEELF